MSHLFLRERRGEVSKKFEKIAEMIDAVARGRTSSLATRPKFPFYVHSIKTLKVRRTAVITVDGKPAKLGEPLNLRKRRPEHARRRVPGENTSKKRLEQKKHQPIKASIRMVARVMR